MTDRYQMIFKMVEILASFSNISSLTYDVHSPMIQVHDLMDEESEGGLARMT